MTNFKKKERMINTNNKNKFIRINKSLMTKIIFSKMNINKNKFKKKKTMRMRIFFNCLNIKFHYKISINNYYKSKTLKNKTNSNNINNSQIQLCLLLNKIFQISFTKLTVTSTFLIKLQRSLINCNKFRIITTMMIVK